MAGSFIRRFTKWFFVSLNILGCIVFLLSCLSPYVSPAQWGPIGFLALIFPYLSILLIFSVIFWLIAKPVVALMPLITLLIGWQQLAVVFAWHPMHTFTAENKRDSSLRIIDWNVRGMYGLSKSSYKQHRNRDDIATAINKLKPDIICLQEFNNSTYEKDLSANNIKQFTNYCPYYFFSRDYRNKNGHYQSGCIIFSKYPIADSGRIIYPGPNAESVIYADIVKGSDTIRVFTTHLQSFQFTESDYADLEKIKDPDEETIQASKNIYSKMRLIFLRQAAQAGIVKQAVDKSPYPTLLCGDFNNVPNSYTYFHLSDNRQDAFLATSFGIGRSFNAMAPTLRIDYILPDSSFNIQQFDMADEGLSDHHMLVADVSLKK